MPFSNICVFPSSILLPAPWPTAQPGPPHYMSVLPGPTSVLFSLKTPPISGGTPITSFVLQWRQSAAEKWKEVTVPTSGRTSALHRGFAVVCHEDKTVQSVILYLSWCVFLCVCVCIWRSPGYHCPKALHVVRSALGCLECSRPGTVLRHKQCSYPGNT